MIDDLAFSLPEHVSCLSILESDAETLRSLLFTNSIHSFNVTPTVISLLILSSLDAVLLSPPQTKFLKRHLLLYRP